MLIKTLKKDGSDMFFYELRWVEEANGFFPYEIFHGSEVVETAPASRVELANAMVQSIEERIQRIRDVVARDVAVRSA
jgi:hypothetical protein